MALYACNGIGEDADGVIVAALGLVQHGLVVHDFEAAGSVLASLEEAFFGVIELMHLAVNLRDAEVDVGVIGHQVGDFLIDDERIGEFFLGHQCLSEPTLMAQFGGV